MRRAVMVIALLALTAIAASAQSPYAGMEARPIKALSEQQIADLKNGRGMGLAMPAELNGYPGPMHVLEHANALALTDEQRERTAALVREMRSEAIPMGDRLIEEEAELDRLFANGEVTPANLQAATIVIGATQGRLREIHLKYHLAMREILTAEQVARYRVLRGYGSMRQHQHK